MLTSKLLTIALVFCALNLTGQTEIFLSEPIQVAPDLTYGNRAPRIVLLEDGNPLVYWGKPGSSPKMYISRWQNDGFDPPVLINTNGIDIDLWASGLGPQLASFGNTVFLVFETYGEGIWCMRSADGGLSFGNPVSVYDLPQGRVATLPTVAVDNDGNPVVSFITTNNQEEEALYEVATSLDGGLSFEPAVVANLSAATGEVCECCPASMTISPAEEMLLTFRNNNNNMRDIWATKSTDGGLTFPDATDLDDTDWLLFSCPISGSHSMIAGDSLIAVYFSSGEGNPRVYLSTIHIGSMAKGDQFKMPTFTGEESGQNQPRIAGNQDTIGVVWEENTVSAKDIVLSYSVNGTSDLKSQLVKITEGTTSFRFPDIAYSNGVFHIVYEDAFLGAVMYRQAGFSPIISSSVTISNTVETKATPNPFSAKTLVDFENNHNELTTAKLFDAAGLLLKTQQTFDSQIEINGLNLSPGIYFLQLQNGEKTAVVKLIRME